MILSGIAEQPSDRDRDAEFALDLTIGGADALAALRVTIDEAHAVMRAVRPRVSWKLSPAILSVCRRLRVLRLCTCGSR